MAYWIYNLVLVLVLPVTMLLLLSKKRVRRGVLTRFGRVPKKIQEIVAPVIWVHAVSYGETITVVPFLRALHVQYPHIPIVVSTVTETGREVVDNRLDGIASHCYAPLDYGWAVKRFIRCLQPRLFVLVEAEFWPNLLKYLHRSHVPICLVNGRISSKSFSRYCLVRGFMRQVLTNIDVALMQSPHDSQRMIDLGGEPSSVYVTGNMKFDPDFYTTKSNSLGVKEMRLELGLEADELVLVAGSTHPGEEEAILATFQSLLRVNSDMVLVMAPRHIERSFHLEKTIKEKGFPCIRKSQLMKGALRSAQTRGARVILLDTRGELVYVYRVGYVGFVGGTFVPIGGHNLLEPAHWGRPVMFGPYIDHCRESARILLESGGAIQVDNQEELMVQLTELIQHPSKAQDMGEKAYQAVQAHRGVIAENLKHLDRLLGQENS